MRSPLSPERRQPALISARSTGSQDPELLLKLSPENTWVSGLLQGEVHVWHRPLTASPSEMERFLVSLSREEASRARSFVYIRDRLDFVVARGFLRELLAKYCDVPARQPEVLYSRQGKPMVLTVPHALHFNVSHAEGQCVIAMAVHEPVGIDLERLDPRVDAELFRNSVFSDREFVEWEEIPSMDRIRAFFSLWTQKESFLKGIGMSQGFPLRELNVTLKPWERPTLVSSRRENDPALWRFETAEVSPEFVCTLALRPSHRELRILRTGLDLFGI